MQHNEQQKNVDELMMDLHSESSLERSKARQELVKLGNTAVPFLMETFNKSKSRDARKEVLLTMKEINDPVAIPFYVDALQDSYNDIRWIGAEAVALTGKEGLMVALKALVEEPDNYNLRMGVHHILKIMKEHGQFNDPYDLLGALDNDEIVNDRIQVAAENSLQDLTR